MTTIEQIENIWAGLEEQPNAIKALVYQERAKIVLAQILALGQRHKAVNGNRIHRRDFADCIGCSYPVLNQNLKIREELRKAEGALKLRVDSPAQVILRSELNSIVEFTEKTYAFRANSAFSKIIYTSDEFKIGKTPYPGIPLILFADGIHEASADWMRDLVVSRSESTGSVKQYAKTLRPFIQYCRATGIAWDDVTDNTLRSWRDYLLNSKGNRKATVNAAISIIFKFYRYCEEEGKLQFRVKCYEKLELPEYLRNAPFPISAKKIYIGTHSRTPTWVSSLLYKTTESSIGNRGTPTSDDLADAHKYALETVTAMRDTCMMSLAEDCGPRVSEILQIQTSQLPTDLQLDDLDDNPTGWWGIRVIRKGGQSDILQLQSDTLYSIKAYLIERAAVVSRCKKDNPNYKEPSDLFISHTTGKKLQRDSVTKLVGAYFKKVGLSKVNIHRIRARFAVNTINKLLDKFFALGIKITQNSNWIDTILQQAAIKMGHKNPGSLKHYLTVELDRRLRLSESRVEDSLEKAERDMPALREAVSRTRALAQLLRELLATPSSLSVSEVLRAHADRLERLPQTA